MKSKTDVEKNTPFLSIRSRLIRKSLVLYFISAVTIPIICAILGWRSLEHIGSGFIYSSLGLTLFGALTMAVNSVPGQLAKLSLPKYNPPSVKHHQKTYIDEPSTRVVAIRLFLSTLICATFLFITGVLLRIIW